MRRIAGSLGAEDGFGGTKSRGVDRVRMGKFFYGMGCKEIIKGCI